METCPRTKNLILRASWHEEQAMCALRGMRDGPYEHIKTWDELSRPLAYEKNAITRKMLFCRTEDFVIELFVLA